MYRSYQQVCANLIAGCGGGQGTLAMMLLMEVALAATASKWSELW